MVFRVWSAVRPAYGTKFPVLLQKMTPPIKDLLPRLTPILKNRQEKVQENCIDLVGRIADRGAEYVPAREWMRICFELLEMLKAHKKGIRRATVNTFGYIAKVCAICLHLACGQWCLAAVLASLLLPQDPRYQMLLGERAKHCMRLGSGVTHLCFCRRSGRRTCW